ncbi:MAG: ABC transporter permease [Hyphomonadaceae bacterium]|nr:ABC transporter permease [Hyphomonadaceae bacterium]
MTARTRSAAPGRARVSRPLNFLFRVFFTFLLRYRRTALGPIWALIGPIVFVGTLGFLYSHIGNRPPTEFLPHIAVGFVTWNLIQSMITGAGSVFHRGRANILQGQLPLDDLVMLEVMTNVVTFLHQCLVIVGVFIIFGTPFTWYSLLSLVGVALIIINGIWVVRLIGLVSARYRDLAEVLPAVMRVVFLATPIIWMQDRGARGSFISAFLTYNPFYHFLELVRSPLLGHPIEPITWIVTISITVLGFVIEGFVTARYARYVPLWV